MKKWIRIIISFLILTVMIYESYFYTAYKANSYLQVNGGELNQYKNDFVLIINDKKIDTLNVNIPTPFSSGYNLSLGKNTVKLISIDSKISFEKNIYFYGFFSFNTIEVTSKEFIYSRHYSLPLVE